MVDYVVSTEPIEGIDVAKRPPGLKQVWMKAPDLEHFEYVAAELEREGIDVKHGDDYSLTKVIRHLLTTEVKRRKKRR